jgi:hypothetical protein
MDCKSPTCQYSQKRHKCIRPNSYIEALSWCRRNKINVKECKEQYQNDKSYAKKTACDRYSERLSYVPIQKPRKNIRKEKKEEKQKTKKDGSISVTSKSFQFSKSTSAFKKVFKPPFIEKRTAKYIKTKKGTTIKNNTKTSKDQLLKNIQQKPKLVQRVFLKDIVDGDKQINKELSNINILPVLSPKPNLKSMSNISKKIRELREKYAANKIQKFIMKKIIQRLETIDGRIRYYKYINEYLKNTPDYVCLKSKKYADKKGNINDGFELGNFLKLVKRIGTESAYGVIYKTVAKNVILTLATKIMPITKDNKYEIRLNQVATEIVKRKLSRHFLMSYKSYECNQPSVDPTIPSIVKNKNYLITLNELAHGDIKTLCTNQIFLTNNDIVANVALQCMFAVATFHSLDYTHNDCHWGNFLFHVNKSIDGWFEYIIYGETFYMKNCGYNIMIYDFGLINKMSTSPTGMNRISGDYARIMHAFISKQDKGWLETYPQSYDIMSKMMHNLQSSLMICMVRKYDDEQIIKNIISFYLNKPILNRILTTTLPDGATILNKDHPFILTKDIYKINNIDMKKSYLRKITPKK